MSGGTDEVGGRVALLVAVDLIETVVDTSLLAVTLAVTDVIRGVALAEHVLVVTPVLALTLCQSKHFHIST